MNEKRLNVLVSIPTDRAKAFLDSRLFPALRERYKVTVLTYLALREDARQAYGVDGMEFCAALEPQGKIARAALAVAEAVRRLGFQYQWRRKEPVHARAWSATVRYRTLMPLCERPALKRLLVRIVAAVARFGLSRQVLFRLVSEFVLRDQGVAKPLRAFAPSVIICSGQASMQEQILGFYASRNGIGAIWLPASPDDVYYNGYPMTEFNVVCAWGPWMRRRLERHHRYRANQVADIGVVMTRIQTDLLRATGGYNIREALDIPGDARIVTYLSVINSGAAETTPAVDALASAVESGRIRNAVIVLRTSPWEDPSGLLRRYGNDPHVRVQVGAGGQFDRAGDQNLAEHARTMRESSVVIMGSITSSVHQTAVWGIPTILNNTELRPMPDDAYSPTFYEEVDLNEFFSAGLPVAHSLEELCDLVAAHLEEPGLNADVWARIASDWDYQNESYVEDFLRLVDGALRHSP